MAENAQLIKTAIFPVGGFGVRFLPVTKSIPKEMLPIFNKPLIQFAVEEAISVGVKKIIFITGRGKSAIENHFDYSVELEHIIKSKYASCELINSFVYDPGSIAYIRQQHPSGLGHAIWCARHYINEPFFVILADDLILGNNSLIEMLKVYQKYPQDNILLLKKIDKSLSKLYGIVEATKINNLYQIFDIVEKPAPQDAISDLSVVGRYILQPSIFDILGKCNYGLNNEIQLTDAIKTSLNCNIKCRGCDLVGEHFDCGSSKGMLKAIVRQAVHEGLKEELLGIINQV